MVRRRRSCKESHSHTPSDFQHGIFSKTRVSVLAQPDLERSDNESFSDTEFEEWMLRNADSIGKTKQ